MTFSLDIWPFDQTQMTWMRNITVRNPLKPPSSMLASALLGSLSAPHPLAIVIGDRYRRPGVAMENLPRGNLFDRPKLVL